MYVLTYRRVVEAGHRLFKYSGNCGRLHGHQYVVDFVIHAEKLDEVGMVIDFNVLKQVVDTIDHKLMLNREDGLVEYLQKYEDRLVKESVVCMPYNPTAENIARFLKEILLKMLGNEVEERGIDVRIKVYELSKPPSMGGVEVK